MNRSRLIAVLLVVALLSGGVVVWPHLPSIGGIVAPAKVTAATYFYNEDQNGVPSPVTAAISELNTKGIVATTHEVEASNPSGKIPKQYEVSQPAAIAAGLPALVVMAGDKVVRVVKAPMTAEQVLEAAK